MAQYEELSILDKDLHTYLSTIKVTRWEHFARYTLAEILSMPGMTFEHLKNISKKLHLKGLDLAVCRSQLEIYYQNQHHISPEQAHQEQLLDTTIEEFFDSRPKIINNLRRENIHTLRDLTSLAIEELVALKNIGSKTIIEIQNKMIKYGLRFANKTPPPRPPSYNS